MVINSVSLPFRIEHFIELLEKQDTSAELIKELITLSHESTWRKELGCSQEEYKHIVGVALVEKLCGETRVLSYHDDEGKSKKVLENLCTLLHKLRRKLHVLTGGREDGV